MGKGSRYRTQPTKRFCDNYDRIFGAKPLNNMESSQESQQRTPPSSKENIERSGYMEDKVLKEAELICKKMFPESEVGQCVLHHYLACFADLVEVVAWVKFREMQKQKDYKIEEVRHG